MLLPAARRRGVVRRPAPQARAARGVRPRRTPRAKEATAASHTSRSGRLFDVGDVLRLSLNNDSGEAVTVVPPPTAWDGMRAALCSVPRRRRPPSRGPSASTSGPLRHDQRVAAVGYRRGGARRLHARRSARWAAPFCVRRGRARDLEGRVRYRAEDIGVTSYTSSPTSSRSPCAAATRPGPAQVERARDHIYANVTPARLRRGATARRRRAPRETTSGTPAPRSHQHRAHRWARTHHRATRLGRRRRPGWLGWSGPPAARPSAVAHTVPVDGT